MTSINDKLGLKRAGKRAFMANLPANRSDAVKVTAVTCPHCLMRGKASPSKIKGAGWLFCTWCSQSFEVPA